ncbi:IS607 family transposase [Glycomyces xiaoerkulensis]|uniref:IS607 family transposase n=1 Tax=Glycomyces xiaoerkulensis TaxID=2038139 RepID=UPI000C2568DA|nr:IS607 family transposase [Glycomyces xiaoerkulensis]
MKLSDWAARQGIAYQTAWRWAKSGRLPVRAYQAPSGTWIVDEPGTAPGRAVAYCRVSSADQKDDLDRQAVRVVEGANRRGIAVASVVAEIGSGMNGGRGKLTRLLSDAEAAVIVVEHRDRLTRFGFEHLEAALSAQGRSVVVLNQAETGDDLVREVTEVLTSLYARLYGRRSAKRRAEAALRAAEASHV